jgi:hypothetical protein
MPLLLSDLSSGFKDMADNPPDSASAAAAKAADIYAAYAQKATAAGIPPTLTGAEKLRLKNALQGAWSSVPSAPPVSASAWLQGLTLFWAAPPVIFGPGAVVGPPLPVVVPCLSAVSAPAPDSAAPSVQVATCIHTATLSVLALIPPSPTPVNLI